MEAGRPGQEPIKGNLLSLSLKQSEAEHKCFLRCSDWWWEELHCFCCTISGDKRYWRRFSLCLLIWHDPFQPRSRAPLSFLTKLTYLLPLYGASSFIKTICMNMLLPMSWPLRRGDGASSTGWAKKSFLVIVWQVLKRTIGTKFSVCGSRVNTELLSLSLCQSNIQP